MADLYHMTNKEIVDCIENDFNIKAINIYPYGSRVYGTDSWKSDWDFIVIVDNNGKNHDSLQHNWRKMNVGIRTIDTFKQHIEEHRIYALEMVFCPKELILKEENDFKIKLNLETLRHSISEKASHSFVKAKKKFEVPVDRDVYIAKKSLFHSLRIINYGIQIATHGRIIDFTSCNDIWNDIENDKHDTWKPYKEKWKPIFNNMMSEFRLLAPKK